MDTEPAPTYRRLPGRLSQRNGSEVAAKVRAGFVPHVRREVFKSLKTRHTDKCRSTTYRMPKPPGGVEASPSRTCGKCSG